MEHELICLYLILPEDLIRHKILLQRVNGFFPMMILIHVHPDDVVALIRRCRSDYLHVFKESRYIEDLFYDLGNIGKVHLALFFHDLIKIEQQSESG